MGPVDGPCGWRPTGQGRLRHAGAMTGSRLGVAALALLAVCLVVVGLGISVGRGSDVAPRAGSRAGAPSGSTDLPAVAVLRAWDRRRADAYAAGSPGQLRALYVRGGGSSGVHPLQGDRARGWRGGGLPGWGLPVAR